MDLVGTKFGDDGPADGSRLMNLDISVNNNNKLQIPMKNLSLNDDLNPTIQNRGDEIEFDQEI
jgi:hypothetical protein